MMKTIVLLLTVFICGSHQQCFSANDVSKPPTLKEYNAWVLSAQNFSLTLLKSLNRKGDFGNVIFSPSSIREALLLAYFGAAHDTEASLAKVLQIPAGQTKAMAWKIYKTQQLVNLRREVDNYPLKIANRIFLSSKLSLRHCMIHKFPKELETVKEDTKAQLAQNYINRWVERETEGKITDFFKYINSYSAATLVNAASFKSRWLSKFDPVNTQPLQFTTDGNYRFIANFMIKEEGFESGRSEEIGARFLLLPHDGIRTGMIVILPDKSLDTVIHKLDQKTFEFITNRKNYKSSYFRLFIPTINKRSHVYLEKALESLGAGNVFTSGADFSRFTGKKDVFITEVVHQAVLKVDEEGSNGTASSGISMERRVFTSEEPFVCDRPFAYIMYDFLARKVLLMGTYRNNDQENI